MNNERLKVILTGASGMVGEGVLIECLQHPRVEEVLVVGRRACGHTHPKLKEVILPDLFNLKPIEGQLSGYNACFFCAGISSVGMKEAEYTRITYTLTINFAETVSRLNPDMVFTYVSGAGTDSTGVGKTMWARVKGRTENDLLKMSFKAVYNFRPGLMKATQGQKNLLKLYKYFAWMYPVLRAIFTNLACTLREVGLGMINAAIYGFNKNVVEVKDIIKLADL